MRYIKIRENTVREQVQKDFIKVVQIAVRLNNSGNSTKDDKDITHFQECRNTLCTPPSCNTVNEQELYSTPRLTLSSSCSSRRGAGCEPVCA